MGRLFTCVISSSPFLALALFPLSCISAHKLFQQSVCVGVTGVAINAPGGEKVCGTEASVLAHVKLAAQFKEYLEDGCGFA